MTTFIYLCIFLGIIGHMMKRAAANPVVTKAAGRGILAIFRRM